MEGSDSVHGNIQNTADLRSQNKKRILMALKQAGELTKKDIAQRAELSQATVSNLVNQMIEEGILTQGGERTSNGGRIPSSVRLASGGWYWLAVNLVTAGRVRLAFIAPDMSCAGEWEGRYAETDYGALLTCVEVGCRALTEGAGEAFVRVISAVAAVPAIFDRQTRRVANSTLPMLEGRRLAEDLREKLGVAVTVENESDLMALACFNADPQMEGLILVYVGEGLGFGTAIRQMLVGGAHGFGGEISHIPLGSEGYLCACGQRNCVETELSVGGFLRKYADRSPSAIPAGLSLEEQWRAYVARLKGGDPAALAVAEDNARLLGVLLSVLVNLLDPQNVYVGGYVEEIADVMLPIAQATLRERMILQRPDGLPVRCVKGYNRLITAGCGVMAFSRWDP